MHAYRRREDSRAVDRVEKRADVLPLNIGRLESLSRLRRSTVLLLSSLLSIFWPRGYGLCENAGNRLNIALSVY